jgi:hypothetical protein
MRRGRMTVDERHRRLQRRLEEVLGPEEARTLMDDLGAGALSRDELRRELRAELTQLEERMDVKLQLLEARMDARMSGLEARLLERMNDQTKSLLRTFMVSNATMVLAVSGLAFGAARLT